MILNNYAKVRLTTSNVEYYKNKGYEIPMKPATDLSKKVTKKDMVYDLGKCIVVRVEDLKPKSNATLYLLCDYCMETEFQQTYNTYQRTIKDINKCACVKCRHLKTKELNELKYGYSWASQTKEFQEQRKQTMISKYGTTSIWDIPEIKEKSMKTCMEKYGKPFYTQTEEFLEKVISTNQERRGVDFPTKSFEVREKVCKTVNEKFGCDNVFQNEEIKQRIKEQNLKLYGVENANQREDIKENRQKTVYKNQTGKCSVQQKYLHLLFGGEINYPIKYYLGDIVLLEEKLCIEYDGSGHQLSVERGALTQEEFNKKEIVRSSVIKSEGYRIVRIISRKDYLPSDTILLQMLQYARDFFIQNPKRSWLSFDIDNSCIYNAYHKETDINNILYYDYGELHKIKNSDTNSISL